MKSKIKEIANGWVNVIVKDEATETIAKYRLDICNSCPNRIIQLGIDVCGECHCPLIAKTRSIDSNCPILKWDK